MYYINKFFLFIYDLMAIWPMCICIHVHVRGGNSKLHRVLCNLQLDRDFYRVIVDEGIA